MTGILSKARMSQLHTSSVLYLLQDEKEIVFYGKLLKCFISSSRFFAIFLALFSPPMYQNGKVERKGRWIEITHTKKKNPSKKLQNNNLFQISSTNNAATS